MINETRIEVRYQETDQMGVVYHANYLVWFEIGRTKLIEQLGFKYAEMEKDGFISPVVDIQASYKQPALYGEDVIIRTWIHTYTGIRTIYAYEVVNLDGEILCTGTSTHVVVNRETFKPLPLKKVNEEWHTVYKELVGDQ